jgi:hypothetical protein
MSRFTLKNWQVSLPAFLQFVHGPPFPGSPLQRILRFLQRPHYFYISLTRAYQENLRSVACSGKLTATGILRLGLEALDSRSGLCPLLRPSREDC